MKMTVVLLVLVALPGCGEIEWFPPSGTFDNVSTATGTPTTPPAFSNNTSTTSPTVTDSAGTLAASNLGVAEVSRDPLSVSISLRVDVVNRGSEAALASVFVAGSDSGGTELVGTFLESPRIDPGQKVVVTETVELALPAFSRIAGWQIRGVERR